MNDMPGYIPPNSEGFDFDPFDQVVTQPLQHAAGASEDNPDDAAQAVDLSKATGVAAPVIAEDLEGFKQLHKQSLTNQIMRSNPALIDYVRSHPMAASVSNDDWSNLAEVSQASNKLESLLALDPLRGALHGAVSGAEEGFLQKSAGQKSIDQWYADKPLTWALMTGLWATPDMVTRGFNAIMGAQFGAIRGGAETAYKAVTGDADAAKDFGQDAVDNANVILAGSLAEASEPSALVGVQLRQREAFQAAKPWLDENLLPPRGVHPVIDEALGELNAEGVTRLQDILQASQKSSTRERSYEMFHNFITQMHGDRTVALSADAVSALYGDKVPEPGDNLLGFVHNMPDQLLAANIAGADVHILIKDWISQVTPEIATQLKDDLRITKGGITAREAQVPIEPKAMVDAPIAQVRGTSGLEPKFALGDRKLTLEQNQKSLSDGYPDDYNFIDSTGQPVGFIHLIPDEKNKELYVLSMGSLNELGKIEDLPNSLGPAAVRDLLRQIQERYSGYTLTGNRVSGARFKAGTTGVASTKLNLDDITDKPTPKNLQDIDNTWRKFGKNIYAYASDAVDTIVHSELKRIVGDFPELFAADEFKGTAKGMGDNTHIRGLMQPYYTRPPVIAWNALSPKAIGLARHEAIHYLRGYGFFSEDEWAALGWHVIQNDWLGKFNIRDRYPGLDIGSQIEEAVAEGYRDWASTKKPIATPDGLVQRAFEKLKDLWEGIKNKIRDVFGRDVDVESLLQQIHEGHTVRRGPVDEPNIPGVLSPKLSEEDQPKNRMVAYHGTDKIFDQFDPNIVRGHPGEEGANFFSKTPQGANKYATGDNANVHKVIIDTTNHKTYDPQELLNNPETRDAFLADLKEAYVKGATRNEYLKQRYESPLGKKLVEDTWKDLEERFLEDAQRGQGVSFQQTTSAIIKRAKEDGVDVATIKNLLESHGQDQVIVLNPDKVTSYFDPKFSIDEDAFNNIKANSLGLDIKSWNALKDSIKSRYQSDLTAAVARAEKLQRAEQTAEWKKAEPGVKGEVERSLRQRPDVAADMFVNSGEYEGTKLRQRIPLREADLTPEQKAVLPENYYSKSGLPVNDVARLFGYQDGQTLIERLSVMAAQRGDLTPQAHLRRLIDGETQLRMERLHGNLESNIMEKASDQALSDTDINLLTDEYTAAGMLAKQPTIDKNVIKAQVQDAFSKMMNGGVSSHQLMLEVAKHDRDAERFLISGDNVSALKSMERKVYSGMMAAEARKLEKRQAQFDKTAKKLSKREVTNLPQSYTNFLHQILAQVSKPIRRSLADLQTEIANHSAEHTLEEFVTSLQRSGQSTQVWEKLFDPTWHKPYKELTVDEFDKVKDSIDSLNYIGKNVKKIVSAGKKVDIVDVKEALIDSLRDFGVKHYDIKGERGLGPLPANVLTKLPRSYLANSLTLETLFGRWDHFDPFGPWTQHGIRGLIEANSEENLMKKAVAKQLTQIYKEDKADKKMSETVFNPLFRDTTGGNLLPFDRSNLRAVMLNTGSRGHKRSNLTYMSQGHGVSEPEILNWIKDHATKEDWDWCQKIWDLFHNELWEPAQEMRRGLDGVGAKSLEVSPIQTPFGGYRGGYYPVIFREIAQSKRSLEEGLFGKDYIRADTWEGYAQERTGQYAPLNLSLDPMTNRINQIIHDIKMRPAILNAAKLFYDKDIQTAIKRYYGQEFADLLIPYLQDVAGNTKYRSKFMQDFEQITNIIQRHMVVNLIGLNIGTIAKHTPTAGALSLAEVGPKDFLHAVRSLHAINEETGQKNSDFIMDRLDELQNRQRNWMETLTGSSAEYIPGNKLSQAQRRIAQFSSAPIAYGDMLTAKPTGLAAYQRAKMDGYNEGDAIFLGNRAVRRAHGSSAITNKSGVQRSLPAMVTTFYTFFNDMLNRRAELVWRAADTLGAVGDHDWAEAKKHLWPIAGGLFSTVLFTAIVEQLVSPIHFDPDESRFKRSVVALARDQASGLAIVRDVANWVIEGRDPALGLYSTAYREFGDVFKDLYKDYTQKQHMSKEQAAKIIKDSAAFIGIISGTPGGAVGKAGEFVFGTHVGTEHPRGPFGWTSGLRYGTLKGHSPTFEDWRKGK